MNENTAIYVGLDVHKETIPISEAEAERASARFVGAVAHNVPKLSKTLNKLGGSGQMDPCVKFLIRKTPRMINSLDETMKNPDAVAKPLRLPNSSLLHQEAKSSVTQESLHGRNKGV